MDILPEILGIVFFVAFNLFVLYIFLLIVKCFLSKVTFNVNIVNEKDD